MIAVTQINILGSETKTYNSTTINHARSAGYIIFDVLVNGLSKNFDVVSVDDYTGKIIIPEVLQRGDLVQVAYKYIPRVPVAYFPEFSSLDFTNDFTI
jgi:hypothetical protein